ncbi:MAG: DUF1080 domain-containing protein [Verrucomicrobia bacterium]|nr:DUF1080 domain-containing protein [Verrucomicrobiota bacterium]
MWKYLLALGLALAWPASGAQRVFDFAEFPADQTPTGFSSVVAGDGPPGKWRIIMDDVPPLLTPQTDKSPPVTKRAVLAQLDPDPTDERFPMLVYEGELFGDFLLTTRFKLVSGVEAQMAGIAFRYQDEKNFYVIRASGLGTNIMFYKVVDGERRDAFRLETDIPAGVWNELSIECKGNQIICLLNGRKALPTFTDNNARPGRIAFWTKSDAVTYFTDARIVYTRSEIPARAIARDVLKKYSRLIGLRIYTLDPSGDPRVVASKHEEEIGQSGGAAEKNCIANGTIYYGKEDKTVSVVMPLRDRNGDPIAAVRLVMQSFAGQTQQNALARARPIVREMQARVASVVELAQ